MSVETILVTVPLLAHLSADERRAVAGAGTTKAYAADSTLFQEGDASDGLYIVLAGWVRLFKQDGDGGDTELRRAGPGEYFGELALIDGGPRSASAATLTPCEFFLLERDTFLGLVSRSPGMLLTLLSNLTGNVRATSDRLVTETLERRAMRAEMELAQYRSLAQMVAGVAHEINTPLGIVNTAASLVRERVRSSHLRSVAVDRRSQEILDDVLEASDLMEANIKRAHKLIQDFKKLSVAQITETREVLDLVEVVEEVVGLFKVNARQAKLEIEVRNEVPDRASRQWHGYRGPFTQVLLNLLSNIERYAYPRGVGGRVEIAVGIDAGRKEEQFVITVRDFGRGISREDQPKVFEPFFTTGRSVGGSGLGMAIVHNIVTSVLKGSIDLASECGAGTTVTLRFPRKIGS